MRPAATLWVAVMALLHLASIPAACLETTAKPRLDLVNDYAGVYSPDGLSRVAQAASEFQPPYELMVVVVSSLKGLAMEQYAQRLYQLWRADKKNKDAGILILLAPKERKISIETSPSLKALLPASFTRSVMDKEMGPAFKRGDFEQGTLLAIRSLAQRLAPAKKP